MVQAPGTLAASPHSERASQHSCAAGCRQAARPARAAGNAEQLPGHVCCAQRPGVCGCGWPHAHAAFHQVLQPSQPSMRADGVTVMCRTSLHLWAQGRGQSEIVAAEDEETAGHPPRRA